MNSSNFNRYQANSTGTGLHKPLVSTVMELRLKVVITREAIGNIVEP